MLKLLLLFFLTLIFAQCAFERIPRSQYDDNGKLIKKAEEKQETKEQQVKEAPVVAAAAAMNEEACELPKKTVLKIACTKGCSTNNTEIIAPLAKNLDYQIEFINLNSDNTLKGYLSADAIIIEGGADIMPYLYDSLYGKDGIPGELLSTVNPKLSEEEKLEWKNKDFFEYDFLKRYFKEEKFARIPVLGICRGMQMLAVVHDIPLYVDLQKQINEGPIELSVEEISITDKTSQIYSIMQNEKFEALENHHQGINLEYLKRNPEKFPHLKITATSRNQKIAETIEFKNREAMGVQFHPEKSGKEVKEAVFKWLLIKACQGKKKVI